MRMTVLCCRPGMSLLEKPIAVAVGAAGSYQQAAVGSELGRRGEENCCLGAIKARPWGKGLLGAQGPWEWGLGRRP